jgi:hypothetical protein
MAKSESVSSDQAELNLILDSIYHETLANGKDIKPNDPKLLYVTARNLVIALDCDSAAYALETNGKGFLDFSKEISMAKAIEGIAKILIIEPLIKEKKGEQK